MTMQRLRTRQHPTVDWGLALLVATGLFWVILIVWRLWAEPAASGPWLQVAYVPFAFVGALLACRAAFHPALSLRQRRVWRLAAVGLAGTWLGYVVLAGYALAQGTAPFPSVADLLNGTLYVAFIYGMLSFPRTMDARPLRLRLWLEVAAVLLGGAMIAGYALDSLLELSQGAPGWREVIIFAYAILDLILFLGMSFYAFIRRGEPSQGPLTIMALGLMIYLLADVVWGSLVLTFQAPNANDWLNLMRMAGQIAMAGAAQYAVHRASSSDQRPSWEVPVYLGRYMPYAGLIMGYGLVLLMARKDAPFSLQLLVVGTGLITGLTIIRQIVVLQENQRLLAESEALTAQLRSSEARFRSLVQNSSDVVMIVTPGNGGRASYLSPSVQHIFGYAPAEVMHQRLITLVHPDDRARGRENVRAVLALPGATQHIEWRLRQSDGTWRYTETVVTNLLHDDSVGGLVFNSRDVTERKELEEQLRRQAYHDALTGLANRTLLRERSEEALRRRHVQGFPVAMLLLDLDGFKHINDSLGHTAGDQLLVRVAERLRECVRVTDTVARLGGDEFAVLLENGGQCEAEAAARRILAALEQCMTVQEQRVFVRCSIGVAVAEPGAFTTVEELLRNADTAMYTAKSRGKACHAVFEPAMYEASVARLEREADLRRAVAEGEFELRYQPLVELQTGRIIATEALVRWRHPMRGMVSPAEFIPLAEETGLILPLGRWVLWEACWQARRWQEESGMGEAPAISVNLSAIQLDQPDLVAQVEDVLRETGLPASRLTLEITETVLLVATEQARTALASLRQLGVRLAIDDFGTGYSSLSYLRSFAVDVVKIDRLFIDGVGRSDTDAALARGIIDLVHALNLETVAEGIERPEQLTGLRELRCHHGQGYLFAQPLEAAALGQLLAGGSAVSVAP